MSWAAAGSVNRAKNAVATAPTLRTIFRIVNDRRETASNAHVSGSIRTGDRNPRPCVSAKGGRRILCPSTGAPRLNSLRSYWTGCKRDRRLATSSTFWSRLASGMAGRGRSSPNAAPHFGSLPGWSSPLASCNGSTGFEPPQLKQSRQCSVTRAVSPGIMAGRG